MFGSLLSHELTLPSTASAAPCYLQGGNTQGYGNSPCYLRGVIAAGKNYAGWQESAYGIPDGDFFLWLHAATAERIK